MTKDLVGQWLDSRGLDRELASKLGLDFVHHRVLGPSVKIPFFRGGEIATVQYRAIDRKDFRFAKDSEIDFWNVDCLKDRSLDSQPLIIAEGVCDGLAIMQSGFQRVIAIPGWSSGNENPKNYEPLKRHEADIKLAERIIVAQHADNTGAAMLRAIANFFEDSAVSFCRWPDDCNDANDALLMHGEKAVLTAINAARLALPPGGVITGFSDRPPREERTIWKTGYVEIDRVMAFRTRAISILTGTPGAGKTTFATWVCHHLVRVHDIRIGLCMFETEPDEILDQLTHLSMPMLRQDHKAAAQKLDRNYRLLHRVDADNVGYDLNWLKDMIKGLVREHCSFVVVDPWNELLHDQGRQSLTQYVNDALAYLRQLADQYNIHILVIAHPRKMESDQAPTGYHISDSAAWVNKPDMGWTVHLQRDENEREYVSLDCWKVRSRNQTGCRPGRIKLDFNEATMSYTPRGWAK